MTYPTIPAAIERKVVLEAIAQRLGSTNDRSREAHGGDRKATPELIAARKEWLRVYRAVKEVVHGLLRLRFPEAEVASRMKGFFADLSVPSTRRTDEPVVAEAAKPA